MTGASPGKPRGPGTVVKALLLLGDVVLMIITFRAYRPGGDGEGRRLQSMFASLVVILLALLFVGALVTGKLSL